MLNKILFYNLQFGNGLLVNGAKTKGIFFALLNFNFIVIQLVKQKYIRRCFEKYIFEFPVLIG